jgi:L-alanine-DL-glutamate epimerase-like enolase superfamily enzyme
LLTACASPVLDWGVNMTHVYLAEDLVRDPLPLENGKIALRTAPGLGVDIDEDAVRRFAV